PAAPFWSIALIPLERKTSMQLASPPDRKGRLLRATRGQHLVPGCPWKLNHLLVLADLQPGSKKALDFAIELAELFDSRLTLMHGGDLLRSPDSWRNNFPDAPEPEPLRAALLCLAWELRQRCPEVGLCID